jgi:metal-responsive CopG/Arc/MetJ family transcriptional regulator
MTAKRVLISIDERLLARVDQARTRQGMTRSAYLAQLAERDLHADAGAGKNPTVRAALTALDALLGDAEP